MISVSQSNYSGRGIEWCIYKILKSHKHVTFWPKIAKNGMTKAIRYIISVSSGVNDSHGSVRDNMRFIV